MPDFLSVSMPRDIASAPISRSGSFKKTNTSETVPIRPRTNSMPNCQTFQNVPSIELSESYSFDSRICRVRSFRTTSKGLKNYGDSVKCSSNNLMTSGNTVTDTDCRPQIILPDSETDNRKSWAPSYFTLELLGCCGVGKTALSRQFLTSECVGYDSYDVEDEETTISVLLDGEESTMEFSETQQYSDDDNKHIDAFIVAFSITDYTSYLAAANIVRQLRVQIGTDRTIMLVANKIDLVRQRKVNANEASQLASKYDCIYHEISAVLNQYVDELLVSTLKQIRLKLSPPVTQNAKQNRHHSNKTCSTKISSPKKVMAFFSKFIHMHHHKKSGSCNNLLAY